MIRVFSWIALAFALIMIPMNSPEFSRVAAADEPASFQWMKSIERESADDDQIVAVELDADVFHATRAGQPDVRVLDDRGVETPYLREPIARRRSTVTLTATPVEIRELRETEGQIEFQLRRPANHPDIEGIRIETPLHDFEIRVSVWGANEDDAWTPLVANSLLYDYRRFADLRELDVRFATNEFRRFKVRVDSAIDEQESPYRELTRRLRGGVEEERNERSSIQRRPFRMDRVLLLHAVESTRLEDYDERDCEPATQRVEHDARNKQTIVYATTRQEPLVAWTIQTSSRNFHRRAFVQVPEFADSRNWTTIGSAPIAQLQLAGIHREQLTLAFAERSTPSYRVVIENEDNPPLEEVRLVGRARAYRIVFLAHPARTYRLHYGSETAQTPQYEAGAVLASLRKSASLNEARLGDEQESQEFRGEPSAAVLRLLNHRYFLATAIVLAVAALSWSLYRAGLRLEAESKSHEQA